MKFLFLLLTTVFLNCEVSRAGYSFVTELTFKEFEEQDGYFVGGEDFALTIPAYEQLPFWKDHWSQNMDRTSLAELLIEEEMFTLPAGKHTGTGYTPIRCSLGGSCRYNTWSPAVEVQDELIIRMAKASVNRRYVFNRVGKNQEWLNKLENCLAVNPVPGKNRSYWRGPDFHPDPNINVLVPYRMSTGYYTDIPVYCGKDKKGAFFNLKITLINDR